MMDQIEIEPLNLINSGACSWQNGHNHV